MRSRTCRLHALALVSGRVLVGREDVAAHHVVGLPFLRVGEQPQAFEVRIGHAQELGPAAPECAQRAALHRGAMDLARALKPSIPTVVEHGIEVRDEIELEFLL